MITYLLPNTKIRSNNYVHDSNNKQIDLIVVYDNPNQFDTTVNTHQDIWCYRQSIHIKILRTTIELRTIEVIRKALKRWVRCYGTRYLYKNNSLNVTCEKQVAKIQNIFNTKEC